MTIFVGVEVRSLRVPIVPYPTANMAARPPKVFVQDMPPKGGFPDVPYKKRPYQRGPASYAILCGVIGVSLAGLAYTMQSNREREYVAFERVSVAVVHDFA